MAGGFPRYEPVLDRPSRDGGASVVLTRQGISLKPYSGQTRADSMFLACMPSLHVAMQMGPSHDPVSWTSGVWSLRILIISVLGFWRFIVSTISARFARPFLVLCRPVSIMRTHRANF